MNLRAVKCLIQNGKIEFDLGIINYFINLRIDQLVAELFETFQLIDRYKNIKSLRVVKINSDFFVLGCLTAINSR